jgi:hypothetical protein
VEDEPSSGKPCTSKTEDNVMNMRALVKSDRHLTVTMIGSELNLIYQTVHGILTKKIGMRTLGRCITTTLPVTLPSPWQKFWPKGVVRWFRSSILAWSESVWLLPFPKTQIPPQRSWVHLKVHTKTSSTATGSGNNVSGSAWLSKGTALKGVMLIFSSVVNKKVNSTSRITFQTHLV